MVMMTMMMMTVTMSVTMSVTMTMSVTISSFIAIGITIFAFSSFTSVYISVPMLTTNWKFNIDQVSTGILTVFSSCTFVPCFGDINIPWSTADRITGSIVNDLTVDIWTTSEWWHIPRGGLNKAVVRRCTRYVNTVVLAKWDTFLNLLEGLTPLPSIGGGIIFSSFASIVVVGESLTMCTTSCMGWTKGMDHTINVSHKMMMRVSMVTMMMSMSHIVMKARLI
jgi:hypothetical protein